MKKFIFLFLIVVVPYQLIADSVIDERVSDIYYGNGILTTKAEADYAKDKILAISILSDIYHGDKAAMQAKHGDEFKLAYNSTFKTTEILGPEDGQLGEVAGGILDIMESYEQLNNTSVGWKAFSALESMVMEIGFKRQPVGIYLKKKIFDYLINKALPDYLATYISVQMTANDFDRIKKLSEKAVDGIIKEAHDRDLKEMVSNYKKSIKAGHGVIAVTHSQGNLFAIETVEALKDDDAWMKDYIHHVSIASPATKFASSKYWLVSLDNDPVPNIPGSVGTNFTNPVRHFTLLARSIDPDMSPGTHIEWTNNPPQIPSSPPGFWVNKDQPRDYVKVQNVYDPTFQITQDYTFDITADETRYTQLAFHAFAYYMGEKWLKTFYNSGDDIRTLNMTSTGTRDAIIVNIYAAILEHKKTPSQWKKTATTGCGCDKRIEVNHKFDPSLNVKMEDLTVIPFDEDAKLYPTGSDYVKAAAEGDSLVKYDSGDICIDLLDAKATKIDDFKGRTPVATSAQGDIEVTLSWNSRKSAWKTAI